MGIFVLSLYKCAVYTHFSDGTIDTEQFPTHETYCGERRALKDNKGGIVALYVINLWFSLDLLKFHIMT